jgi:hypothetical protein
MSEEHNLEEFVEEIVINIFNAVEPDSIKSFLELVEDRLKDVLIEEGHISKPSDVLEVVEEKYKVKDLGNGFMELADVIVSETETTDSDSDYEDSD